MGCRALVEHMPHVLKVTFLWRKNNLASPQMGGKTRGNHRMGWSLSLFTYNVQQGNITGNQGTKLDLETLKGYSVADEMTWQVRALTSKSDIPTSIPGTHSERRSETLEHCVLTSTHTCAHRH